MRVINLTPHPLMVCNDAGSVVATILATGKVARVTSTSQKTGVVEVAQGVVVDTVRTKFGQVIDLPEPQDDTTYVVSILVLTALGGSRGDVVSPDTGPEGVVRNSDGSIKGVKRFVGV